MRKYTIIILCFVISFGLMGFHAYETSSQSLYMYPNLPAPIGKEPMLITSAGQSVEGGIIKKLANQLHLENDYRPRALASDLYEYKTLVIVVGYSYNGLLHKGRQFKQEQKRVQELMIEAEKSNLPVVVFDLNMQNRDYKETWAMVDQIMPYTDYFIGRRYDETPKELMEKIERHRLASTFVSEIQDMKIPFNSVFR